jgi:hypothetical protein
MWTVMTVTVLQDSQGRLLMPPMWTVMTVTALQDSQGFTAIALPYLSVLTIRVHKGIRGN